MLTKVNMKSEKVQNTKVIVFNFKENKKIEIWPIAFNPFVTEQKVFPISRFYKMC